MIFQALETPNDFEHVLARSQDSGVFIYKHSETCPISYAAEQRLKAFSADYPVYRLVVQRSKTLSNDIASSLKVRHETPQLILLHKGLALQQVSHGQITQKTVQELWNNLNDPQN